MLSHEGGLNVHEVVGRMKRPSNILGGLYAGLAEYRRRAQFRSYGQERHHEAQRVLQKLQNLNRDDEIP